MQLDPRRLQTAVHVNVDGVVGPVTWAATFRKCGAENLRAVSMGIAMAAHAERCGFFGEALRLAHFLAQLMHESANFLYMEEIASGAAYEGREDLGNTQPGDGKRYKGRGPIQVTGRANYRRYGRLLGIDLESNPTLASDPSIGFLVSLTYWDDKRLNELADRDDIKTITQKINGGFNGLADRRAKFAQVKSWLL